MSMLHVYGLQLLQWTLYHQVCVTGITSVQWRRQQLSVGGEAMGDESAQWGSKSEAPVGRLENVPQKLKHFADIVYIF